MAARQALFLDLQRRRVILVVAKGHRAVLILTQQRQGYVHGPRRRAVDDGEKPRIAAAPRKDPKLTDLRRRQNDRFIPVLEMLFIISTPRFFRMLAGCGP
jgi:hypothetical protein